MGEGPRTPLATPHLICMPGLRRLHRYTSINVSEELKNMTLRKGEAA